MKQFNKDFLKLLQGSPEPFAVQAQPINQVYKTTINEQFHDVQQFEQLVDALDNAQQGDIVHIRLSTIGGALHAIIPLINSMKNTEAFIHVHVESDTASAGTMVMALAHSLYVNEYTTIMYHNVQYSAGGHGGNVEAQVRHITASSKKLIRDLYNGLLTEEEIKRIEDGLELYLTAEEAMERFNAREQALQDAEDAAEEAAILKMIAEEEAAKNPVAMPKPGRARAKKAKTAEAVVE